MWSGARDLNPGPHGPEPAQQCVLLYPGGSFRVLLYSIAEIVVSSRVLQCLLVPELRDTAVTSPHDSKPAVSRRVDLIF